MEGAWKEGNARREWTDNVSLLFRKASSVRSSVRPYFAGHCLTVELAPQLPQKVREGVYGLQGGRHASCSQAGPLGD